MEGELLKFQGGLFSAWQTFYFVLHQDTFNQLDSKTRKPLGSVHLKVAKVSAVARDPLQICLFNGTNDVIFKAKTIKEKVAWQNALVDHIKKTNEGAFQYLNPK